MSNLPLRPSQSHPSSSRPRSRSPDYSWRPPAHHQQQQPHPNPGYSQSHGQPPLHNRYEDRDRQYGYQDGGSRGHYRDRDRERPGGGHERGYDRPSYPREGDRYRSRSRSPGRSYPPSNVNSYPSATSNTLHPSTEPVAPAMNDDPYADEERIPPPRRYAPPGLNPGAPLGVEAKNVEGKWEKGVDMDMHVDSYGYGSHPSQSYPANVHGNQHHPRPGQIEYQGHQGYQGQGQGHYAGGGGGGGAMGEGREVVVSEPAKDVIFLGLDLNVDEEIMLTYLRSEPFNLSIDTFTVVRDRATGQSRGFGFALFASLDCAVDFVKGYGPHLHIPPLFPGCEPMDARVDFSSHSSSNTREYVDRNGNDGMRDIGPPGNGNRVLLVRGLNSQTSQEEVRDRLSAEIVRLADTMPSHGRGKVVDGRQAIKRVVIVRHRNTKTSIGLAFVEFVSTELAGALLAHLLSRVAQPVGVVVNGRPVACSFANPEAFVIAQDEDGHPLPSTNWLIKGEPDGGIGDADGWVRYRDDWHGASEVRTPPAGASMAVDPNLEPFLQSLIVPLEQNTTSKGKQDTADAAAPKLLDRSAGAIKMQPLKVSLGAGFKKKDKEDVMVALPVAGVTGSRAEIVNGGPLANVLGDVEDDEPAPLPSKTFPGRSKHVVPPLGSHKKMASNMAKWQTRQGELKADLAQTSKLPAATQTSAGVNAIPIGIKQPGASSSQATTVPPETDSAPTAGFDYRDLGKMACLLCQRQFKTLDILGRHCNASDLHKKNLADTAICQAGQERRAAISPAEQPNESSAANPTMPSYRDRAAERRQVFYQPAIPLPEESRAAPKRKFAKAPTPPPPKPAPGPAPGEDGNNKGNQLLKKMGWTEGTGLGLEGEGIQAPVQTFLFAEKAGIGASKGKDTANYTGFEAYGHFAKDSTLDRYKQAK